MVKKDKPLVKVADGKAAPSTEELLHKIIPVKHFVQDAREWSQSVSSDPATRLDVIGLQVCASVPARGGGGVGSGKAKACRLA